LAQDVLTAEGLPYRGDGASLFGPVADRPWAMLLDSGGGQVFPVTDGQKERPESPPRYDILVVEPRVTLVTRGPLTTIRSADSVQRSPIDPFDLVRTFLGPRLALSTIGPADGPPDLPFHGGALGYFGYDLARRIERLPVPGPDPLGMPEMAIGIYDHALLVDQGQRQTWLVGRRGASPEARALLRRLALGAIPYTPRPFTVRGPVRSNMDAAAYAGRFAEVQEWIQSGDCYQVNLARRLSVAAEGDPWAAYVQLRALSPAPFAAYLNLPFGRVLSSSPERFLRLVGGQVETSPIKGTRPRGADPEEDRRLAAELYDSPKDRAENLMIVDLLRNDLGRTCVPGTIRVPSLFEVERYPGVHHLVSTITGRLAPGRDALDLLRGCFPGGSITGAPKIRAMQIIDALEGEARGVYCGSIAHLGFDGGLDSNIAIRTLVHARGELRFWAGGGIVADSECAAEWEEIRVKAAGMRTLVERIGGLVAGRV
jgi:para-aminobenzoate synthetase component I